MSIPKRYEYYTKIAESLGFTLEIMPGCSDYVFVIKHEPSNSQVAYLSRIGCEILDFLNTCRWASTCQELEERVANLEHQLNNDCHRNSPARSQAEYERYLSYFKQKIPEFEACGITLVIDEQKRKVSYINSSKKASSNSHPILYNISKSGYNMAVNALRAQYKRNHLN